MIAEEVNEVCHSRGCPGGVVAGDRGWLVDVQGLSLQTGTQPQAILAFGGAG